MNKHGLSSIYFVQHRAKFDDELPATLCPRYTYYPTYSAECSGSNGPRERVTILPVVIDFYIWTRFPVESMKTEVTTERVKNIEFVSSWRIFTRFCRFLAIELDNFLFICSAFQSKRLQ